MAAIFQDNSFQIKQHQAIFWGGATTPTIYTQQLSSLSDITKSDIIPTISIAYSLMNDCLQLSFFIEKKSWLQLPPHIPNELNKADFLWQDNCLECFVEFNHQQGYHEINLSPKGDYAIYQFDNYRTPDCMPPKHGEGTVCIIDSKFDDNSHWQYHWAVKFSHQQRFSKVHPTAILYHHDTPIFYAHQHANPPDFHDKAFWIAI